jgi:ribosomal protein L11 methylase PrmA
MGNLLSNNYISDNVKKGDEDTELLLMKPVCDNYKKQLEEEEIKQLILVEKQAKINQLQSKINQLQVKINQHEEQIKVLKKEIEDNDFESEKQKYLERVSKGENAKLLIKDYEELLKEIDKNVREYRDSLGYKNIQKEISKYYKLYYNENRIIEL